MSTVSSSTAATSATSTTGTTITPASDGLGENDFLNLMMDQLENQNPLSPDDPTQYLSELASFSSLEAENNIASSASSTASEQASATAVSLIGHTVSYIDTSGADQTGTVSSVQFSSSGPTLTIGTTSGVALSSVSGAS